MPAPACSPAYFWSMKPVTPPLIVSDAVPAGKKAELHSFLSSCSFRLRSALLIVKRTLQNTCAGPGKFRKSSGLLNLPVIALSESRLWNPYDTEQSRILTAGKVQNLRIAMLQLDGIEVPANAVFSFWKQVGKPSSLKGFVAGREIREGCLVPVTGGGLCQLSNALYDAALKAGFEILERHRHSKVVKGSLAELDRDATVKWNYIDLRFRSKQAFRLEVEMTQDQLVVRLKSREAEAPAVSSATVRQPDPAGDCCSCNHSGCSMHRKSVNENTSAAFILDEQWPEYDRYINSTAKEKDLFILPGSFVRLKRYRWNAATTACVRTLFFATLKRALALRMLSRYRNSFSLKLRFDRQLAAAAAKRIPPECIHLVVSQNLLPFLAETGALGGRTYDVLMTGLPFAAIHQQLDRAAVLYPESTTLNDFRAPDPLVALEMKALQRAEKIITPHRKVAALFPQALLLDWQLPQKSKRPGTGTQLLFPAPAFGRKGAYEVRRLAEELDLTVVITGKKEEAPGFWKGVSVQYASESSLENAALVILPAYTEQQPRFLLKALASGIPVVASDACGLSPLKNVTLIKAGDYEALKAAVQKAMSTTHDR